jgi:hypothetical protein
VPLPTQIVTVEKTPGKIDEAVPVDQPRPIDELVDVDELRLKAREAIRVGRFVLTIDPVAEDNKALWSFSFHVA